ncbi:hypothetical protein [Kitasatospora sp. NPDC057015]|uniref:hypothetical protein n=1 Tax=Kitasatospora sp. NPDC057015 TaxID=3346001 RepID=UPI00362524A8
MSLTRLLDDKTSALRVFFDSELPVLRALRASYRATRSHVLPTQRPEPQAETRWGTLGAAIDHRLRWSLRAVQLRGRSVDAGISMAGEYAPILQRVGAELLDTIDELIVRERLDDRSLPVSRASETEERLARLAYVAALFEEVFRTGQVWPSTALAQADGFLTLEALLRAVPDHEARDVVAMVERSRHGGLEALRAATAPDLVVLAPTFAGSADVAGADADWIADRTLVDVKATVTPDKLPGKDIHQLAGYLLLDYEDDYRIERLGWYHARNGALTVWETAEFLTLLGARDSLPRLRERLRAVLTRAAHPR